MAPIDSTPAAVLLPLAVANLASSLWTYVCIAASTDRDNALFEPMHQEVVWVGPPRPRRHHHCRRRHS